VCARRESSFEAAVSLPRQLYLWLRLVASVYWVNSRPRVDGLVIFEDTLVIRRVGISEPHPKGRTILIFLLFVATIIRVDVTFDQAKDAANLGKHGVSLTLAWKVDWSMVMAYVDIRKDYKEIREIGFYPIRGRLYCVVFTQRGDAKRVISLRKASNREINEYERQT
jgi:uncharacterized DUF497 family protein